MASTTARTSRILLAAGTAHHRGRGAASADGVAARRDARAGAGETRPGRSRRDAAAPFLLGLNTSTIRGQKLSIVEEIAIAEKAGYQGMEPWIDELERHAASGGSLEDLGKRFRDAGISVESAIGFFEWIVDDPARRRRGWKRPGGAWSWSDRSAASAWPPRRSGRPIAPCPTCSRSPSAIAPCSSWATRSESSRRSRSGDSRGRSGRLGEAALVAMEADHPKACILPDVYHLHRGGSGLGGIKLLVAPGDPRLPLQRLSGRSAAREADRRRPRLSRRRRRPAQGAPPGPGSAGGFRVMLSLELFNRQVLEPGSADGGTDRVREDEGPGRGRAEGLRPGRPNETGGPGLEPPVG